VNFVGQLQPTSEKTICYLVGAFCCIDSSIKTTQVLCLVPTKELARKVYDDALLFSNTVGISVFCIDKVCEKDGMHFCGTEINFF
jgi:superfamily II DNA/RNA helicase